MPEGYSIHFLRGPDAELATPSEVEVYERMGASTTFRLTYPLDIVDQDLPLLAKPGIGPEAEVAIFVESTAGAECLVKGPVYAQTATLRHGGSDSSLDVMGGDRTIVMDREDKALVWSEVSDSDAVTQLLGQYGLTPDVESTPARHTENKRSLVQRETDLVFIRRLARANGCLFWITTDPAGMETAHFRRPPVGGLPAGDLLINLESSSLESLTLNWDVERPTATTSHQLDGEQKSVYSASTAASPLSSLGGAPLSSLVSTPRTAHVGAAVAELSQLQALNEGYLIESGFFVTVHCTTTFQATQKVIRAHTLIDLRGLGALHSGTYFCSAVRHVVSSDRHRMDIELVRNGWNPNA